MVAGWALDIDVSALRRALPASCYVSGVVPNTFPMGPTTVQFQAVTFERDAFEIAFDEANAPTIKMGDAPTYAFPEAIANGTRGATAQVSGVLQTASLGPVSLNRFAIETRVLQTQLSFTRNGDQASGMLTLTARYRCVDNGSAAQDTCPRAAPFAPDAAECTMSFPFTGQRLMQVPQWVLPATPSTAEAFALLLDERSVDNALCYVSRRVPQMRFAHLNLPTLLSLQRATLPSGQALRMSVRSFRLGDSPEVVVNQPLLATATANQFTLTAQRMSLGPSPRTSTETRSSVVTLTLPPTATTDLTITSNYACVDSGPTALQQCPVPSAGGQPAQDAASCTFSMSGTAYRLP